MFILYLVVMVAANTKYSINSLISPAPDVAFLQTENRACSRRGGHPIMDATP
jgi:hypothetical protein